MSVVGKHGHPSLKIEAFIDGTESSKNRNEHIHPGTIYM